MFALLTSIYGIIIIIDKLLSSNQIPFSISHDNKIRKRPSKSILEDEIYQEFRPLFFLQLIWDSNRVTIVKINAQNDGYLKAFLYHINVQGFLDAVEFDFMMD